MWLQKLSWMSVMEYLQVVSPTYYYTILGMQTCVQGIRKFLAANMNMYFSYKH
jgi:hypothetical protein